MKHSLLQHIYSPSRLGRSPLGMALAALIVVPAVQAMAEPSPRLPAIAPVAAPASPIAAEYRLGPNDVIDIVVSNHPDLNGTFTVRPDGKLTVPRAGEVTAKGKTANALALEVQRLLARTLNNARVTVVVKEAKANQARIIGAVNTSGSYVLRPGARIMDLIAAAGGLSTKPNRISGRIVRAGNVIPLNLALAVAQPGGRANLQLKVDDLVVLDAQEYARQLSVAGSVQRPGAYDLEEGLTVTALLAQAGGPAPNASLRNAHVLRNGQKLPLNLVSGMSTRADFVFQPGDVLVVPENQDRIGILGRVANPAYYPLPETVGDATLLKALALAGGAAADADLSRIGVTRTEEGQSKVLTVDAAAMMTGRAPDNFTVAAGDVIFVPRKDDQVHVVGQVARPGAYPLKDGMNLISLLSEAGNQTAGAALSRAYVLRDGKQIPVNLRVLLVEGKIDPEVAGFKLKNGDVLAIPDVSEQIHINGQIGKPGAYDLDDGMTVYSLLSKAGNPLPSAALSQAYVLRSGQRIQMDLRSVTGVNPDPVLSAFAFEPGDVLILPENPRKIAVLGQVGKPGTYNYPENANDATILKVLANAGGPLAGAQGANLSQAVILRNVNGAPSFIPLNLQDLLKKGDKSNVILQPDDVLYIPAKGKSFNALDLLGPATLLNSVLR